MNKRIGVFIAEIGHDYQKIVTQTAIRQGNSLGYDVVSICSYGSYSEDYLYAEGEKNSINLPDCSCFDGIIITEDVFDIDGMPDQLYNIIRKTAKCPVVYLRSTREGCYSILTENTKPIEEIVRHFIDVHGFNDICYMSGKKGAEDAKERLTGYLNVMKEHNFPVTDNMIFHGDYWHNKGKEAVDWFMQGRETYPQAIVCANDNMALSVVYELNARGVRVPEDVCVTGFDYLDDAKYCVPSLTSFEVDFEQMVVRAVEVIDNVNNGINEEKISRVNPKLRLHKSCGCGIQYIHDKTVDYLSIERKHIDDTKDIIMLVSDYQYAFEFDEYMSVAYRYKHLIRSNKVYFCFTDPEEIDSRTEEECSFTENMILRRIFDGDKEAKCLYRPFSRRNILPNEYWKDNEFNNFFIFSMHFKNIVQGYMVVDIPDEKWFDIYTQGYIMALANAIQNSDLHKKLENLEAIKDMYQNDSLTGILNRRGFDKMLQDRYALANKEGKTIGVASIDMDNLKIINDTYGHAEGDEALIILARSLCSVLKEDEFCARVGGDEFAAVINISSGDRCTEFRNDLMEALSNSGFVGDECHVDASIGICMNTDKDASSVFACLQIADERMYDEKKNKKKMLLSRMR